MHAIVPSASAIFWPMVRRALPLAIAATLALFAAPKPAPEIVEVTLVEASIDAPVPSDEAELDAAMSCQVE